MALCRYFLLIFMCFSLGGWGPFFFFSSRVNDPIESEAWLQNQIKLINSKASNLDPTVLKLSLKAYRKARRRGLDNKEILTIVDYTKPSTERRLWVIDLKNERVLFNTWVTHAKNSGLINATSFSNEPGSLKSSLGLYLTTGEPYVGGVGFSLRLIGLEQGFNDNAYERAILVHGAWYADPHAAKSQGLGRSWGCLAVGESTIHPLINIIKDKTLIFVYYPDRKWLHQSTFLV